MKPYTILILIMILSAPAFSETPVSFADANLKAAVEAQLGVTDPAPTHMLDLTTLTAGHLNITSLTGLEYATNLTRLILYYNQISQLGPLANLTKLTYLDMDDNRISDLSSLAGLTELRHLDLDDNQITDISALSDLSGLRTLYLEDNQISDISALANLRLGTLSLEDNRVNDLSPIAGITSLKYLLCESNGIRDISALSALTQLLHLDAHDNHLSDISALSGLTRLREIHLYQNQISCIQPLTALTNLNRLDVSLNPLNRSAYQRHLPWIADNNPGLDLIYDPEPQLPLDADPCEPVLLVSSTAGGSVVLPSEGQVFVCPGETLTIEAKADSDVFVFAGWTGTAVDKDKIADPNESSTVVIVDDTDTLRAHFTSTLDTLIVDSSGDPNGDGTPDHPLAAIQDAIDVADSGTRIIIRPGTYYELLRLDNAPMTLTGQWLIDPNVTALSVIDGNGMGPVVTVMSEPNSHYILEGLKITGGYAETYPALRCEQGIMTLSHCLISGHRATAAAGDILSFGYGRACLEHCVVTGNQTVSDGMLIEPTASTLVISHSIVWNNLSRFMNPIDGNMPDIQYSVVEGGWPGLSIFDVDPLFAENGNWSDRGTPENDSDDIWLEGDYHLRSRTGRYDSIQQVWIKDDVTSPCIDAGDSWLPWQQEPMPHGGRINIGLYGGTSQASLSEALF